MTPKDLIYVDLISTVLESLPEQIHEENNGFYWDVYSPEKNRALKEKMVQCFISDLTQRTKNYSYYFDFTSSQDYDEMKPVYELLFNDSMSIEMKIQLNHLIDNDGELFLDLLSYAKDEKNLTLYLGLLEKKIDYGQLLSFSDNHILSRIVSYCKVLSNLFLEKKEDIVHAFINHIDQSFLIMPEAGMIDLYHKTFGQDYLNLFLNHFNLGQLGALFLETEEKCLSTIKISVKSLSATDINKKTIELITQAILDNEMNFPHFFVLEDNNSAFFTLAIETKMNHAEQKVKMLIEQVIESKYVWLNDSRNKYQALLFLTKQINEKIDLEHLIGTNKLIQTKIKI